MTGKYFHNCQSHKNAFKWDILALTTDNLQLILFFFFWTSFMGTSAIEIVLHYVLYFLIFNIYQIYYFFSWLLLLIVVAFPESLYEKKQQQQLPS